MIIEIWGKNANDNELDNWTIGNLEKESHGMRRTESFLKTKIKLFRIFTNFN